MKRLQAKFSLHPSDAPHTAPLPAAETESAAWPTVDVTSSPWTVIAPDDEPVIEIEGEATAIGTPLSVAEPPPELPALIDDHPDDTLIVGIEQRHLQVATGETAHFQLTLVNNGDRSAQFQVRVEGWVDESWVKILRVGWNEAIAPPAYIWLRAGERALLVVAIAPPRAPTSVAGDHALAIVVRAAEYPGHFCRIGAQLTIKPYHHLTLGAPYPRRIAASWQQRSAQLTLPVTNLSNQPVTLFLQGQDAQNRCRFAFVAPRRAADPSGRTTITLPAGKSAKVNVQITLRRPPLVGLRRALPVRLTTGILDAPAAPLISEAALTVQPLVGFWPLATLFALLGLSLIGALLVTIVAAVLTSQPVPTAQPTAPPPSQASQPVVTVLVNLAQPVPTTQPAPIVVEGPQAQPAAVAATTAAAPPPLSAPDPSVPVVSADQVTAPRTEAMQANVLTNGPNFQPVDSVQFVQPAPVGPATPAPQTYQQMFQSIALRYDLKWQVLAAQAYVESSFDTLALGSSGDMGLMQILPNTWREWAPTVDVKDPFDAYSNVLVGAAYLDHLRRELGKRNHPEIQWMLVAYNWGIDKLNDHLDAGLGWDDLPAARRQYAQDILRIAETIRE